ncbi:DUF6350 family protein [Nocardioides sp. TRM66260-LWL]|uniref:cell division protein PerM n=1 Tax=Nocardioides sp. TRM66260-LWL TaxID=2874478 RepID=UPI001CC4E7A1|nr:DUF6350 family protein [Nocardioides sp. TRM66260-LWL]MBZ5733234.1 DUF6350 family protein [Nocardioides sp. TRM66260-LWL]
MASLISRPASDRDDRTPGGPSARRPLALLAGLAGATAALLAVALCGALGVIGWFLTDLGAHGTAGDGLRVGALGWLAGLGSGVTIEGTPVTLVPLGATVVAAWAVWRCALRLGEAVAGHGPDADALADGVRDWTVPTAVGLLAAGHLVVAIVVAVLAGGAQAPDLGAVTAGSLLLCAVVGGSAVAVGSGRAALWLTRAPATLRVALRITRQVVLGWLAVSAAALLLALVLDVRTAANIVSQLHAGAADVVVILAACLVLLPNAVLLSSAYLAGPGFVLGTGTLVAPAGAVLGPLPLFPLLAALPDAGPGPAWAPALLVLPGVVAALAAARAQRHLPASGFDEAALRGCVGGVLAGVALGVLTALAGGSIGPGRLQDVGPLTGDVLVQAVVSFGLGAVIGSVAAHAWARRRA